MTRHTTRRGRGAPGAALLLGSMGLLGAACVEATDGPPAFAGFVRDLVEKRTAETNEPLPLDGRTFAFDEDPSAFDALLDR